MAELAANRRLVLDLSRAYQVQLHPAALTAIVAFVKSAAATNGGGEKEAALHGLFACLGEVVSGASSTVGGASSSSSASTAGGRHVSAENVAAAVGRYYTISGVKAPPASATAATAADTSATQRAGQQQRGGNQQQQQHLSPFEAASSSASATNVTARLQLVPPSLIPCGLVDPHSGGVSLHANANAAATATGTFLRADRQFALTQRYLAALGRCHRSGLYRKGVSSGGVGAGDDRRPALVPITSLEGLPEHIDTALLGILQFAPLADGSGSGTATDNLGSGLGSTAVGWRLEDPRATIPLLFPPNFDSNVTLLSSREAPIIVADNENDGEDAESPASPTSLMRTAGLGAPSQRVGFLLKGACVVAMGKWTPDGYLVRRLELPPGEARDTTLAAQNGLDTFGLAPHDAVRARATEVAATDDVIIFIARVHLDKSSVHYKLSKLFGALRERSDAELAAMTFVLVGDFSSKAVASGDLSHFSEPSSANDVAGNTNARNQNQNTNASSGVNDPTAAFINGREGFAALFDQLAATISAAAPNIAQHARFVLVPGPRDLSLLRGVVPQPPIPLSAVLRNFVRRVPHAVAAPNPCRLRFLTKEITIAQSDFYQSLRAESFRVDTRPSTLKQHERQQQQHPTTLHSAAAQQQHLRRLNAVHVDDDDDAANGGEANGGPQKAQPFEHVVKTIIDHAHLFPAVPSSAAAVLTASGGGAVGNTTIGNLAAATNASAGGGASSVTASNPILATARTATSSSALAMQRNIVWAQDSALRLAPLPHFLLLCDQTAEWSCTYRGCRALNPGCFSSTGSFVWFTPSDGEVTFNTI